MNNGLPDETIAHIRTLFRRNPRIDKAILYGSRAKGTYQTGSSPELLEHIKRVGVIFYERDAAPTQ